jgi:YVTN family beta-propeller protein
MDVYPPIDIGTDFVGYRLEELIGRGGMGVVYRAFDLRLKRQVALKLIAPPLTRDERFRRRFERETELAMSLEHPNVVPIYDAGDVDTQLYLAMRLVDGADLGKLLRSEGPLDAARALAICRQVAGALDAAHAQGLVHRDVKPSNVLLDGNDHVYLADFGLTRRLDEPEAELGPGSSIGTPAYLAPEQLEGKAVDARADVYSLGCVLFECLAGTPPYAGGSRLETAWAHLEEEPPSANALQPDLPQSIDPVIRSALAKEPHDRPLSAGALITASESALGFHRRPALGRRTLLLVAAAIVAATLAAGATLVFARDSHGKPAAPLFAHQNTLVRVDPATNRVSAVVHVGSYPAAIAVGGHSVWVYNEVASTISEVDIATNRVQSTTAVTAYPLGVGQFAGPALAADASGAWFASGAPGAGIDRARLTNVLPGGGKHEYRLGVTPTGVAVGDGAVWVVGQGAADYEVLRIDPGTGRVERRVPFPASSPVDSIATAFGAVWVLSSSHPTLYRIDPRSARLTGRVGLGRGRAGRPEIIQGSISVQTTREGGWSYGVEPSSVTINGSSPDPCCPPARGEESGASPPLWWDDSLTGLLYRQNGEGLPIRAIHVTENPPDAGGPCLTSIATAAGAVWLTVAPSGNYGCDG